MYKSPRFHSGVRNIALNHNQLISKPHFSFVKEFEKCFSSSIFCQIAGSVFVICFCCLQLSKVRNSEATIQLEMYYILD
jgi:hypothetical protein